MSQFLEFINTADQDTLRKISGISNTIADNIIKARPFEDTEDLILVHGVGRNLMARIQTYAETNNPDSVPSTALHEMSEAAESPALPAPMEQTPPQGNSQPSPHGDPEKSPSFLSRLGAALLNLIRAFFRLVATVLVIAGFGAAFYYGIPYINEQVILPIQQNSANIRQMQTEMLDLRSQIENTRSRLENIETSLQTHTDTLSRLEQMQAALEKETSENNNSVMQELQREIVLTRSVEFLSRARLFLSMSNFGLARTDIQSARDQLAQLRVDHPEYKTESIQQALIRLDLALGNLPDFPVIAVGDVDIAMQYLLGSSPSIQAPTETAPAQTTTPTPATGTPTPTP